MTASCLSHGPARWDDVPVVQAGAGRLGAHVRADGAGRGTKLGAPGVSVTANDSRGLQRRGMAVYVNRHPLSVYLHRHSLSVYLHRHSLSVYLHRHSLSVLLYTPFIISLFAQTFIISLIVHSIHYQSICTDIHYQSMRTDIHYPEGVCTQGGARGGGGGGQLMYASRNRLPRGALPCMGFGRVFGLIGLSSEVIGTYNFVQKRNGKDDYNGPTCI
jgi:hypothetical protein